MTLPPPQPPGRPPSRWRLYLPFLALALVCVGWSVFWMFAARATETALDEWLGQERMWGRNWSCPDRSVGGYPFRIEVRCGEPAFAGRLGGVRGEGKVGNLLAAANLYNPSLIVGEVASPLTFRSDDGAITISLSWKQLRASHRNRNGVFETGALEIDQPDLRVEATGLPAIAGRAERFEAYARPGSEDPGSSSLDVAIRSTGITAPALATLTGSANAIDALVSATAQHTAALVGSNLPTALERWRSAMGAIDVREMKVVQGNTRVEASGQLSLDDAHRIRGQFDVQLAGMSALLQKFGIPLGNAAINDLIGGLLGGRTSPAPNDANAPRPLRLPLTLANGRASIGPVRLPLVLTPLY